MHTKNTIYRAGNKSVAQVDLTEQKTSWNLSWTKVSNRHV